MTRRTVLGLALAAILGGGAFVVLRSAPGARLQVVEVTGEAERQRGDARAPLAAGEVLDVGDRLRTGAASSLTLQYGEDTRVHVEEGSSLSVQGVSAEGLALELERGRLRATVRPDQGRLRVSSRGVVVTSEGGEAAFSADDEVFGAEATTGELSVDGAAGVSQIGAGQAMLLASGEASVGPIQKDLLLAVDWPELTTQPSMTVTVATAPAAVVSARGPGGEARARANREGKAFLQVPLAEGENDVEFVVIDPFGRRRVRRERLRRDSTRPVFRIDVK